MARSQGPVIGERILARPDAGWALLALNRAHRPTPARASAGGDSQKPAGPGPRVRPRRSRDAHIVIARAPDARARDRGAGVGGPARRLRSVREPLAAVSNRMLGWLTAYQVAVVAIAVAINHSIVSTPYFFIMPAVVTAFYFPRARVRRSSRSAPCTAL